ncbi:MAG: hypothetical protein WCK94_13920, partial [Comamonadaceae bacterium]
KWTGEHFLSINSKRMDIQRDDLMLVAERFQVPAAKASIERVRDAVQNWAEYATRAGCGRRPESVVIQPE